MMFLPIYLTSQANKHFYNTVLLFSKNDVTIYITINNICLYLVLY